MTLFMPDAVLFDLDGTLVDSAPDLTTAVNRMLTELGRAAITESRVREWIGHGARRLVARALAGQRDIVTEPPETEAAMARFFVHYHACLVDTTILYPGVREALPELQAMGLAMGLVTNKPEAFTTPLVSALGLDPFLSVSVSGDTLAVKKPDPAPLQHAAQQMGVAVDRCLYVGDSRADLDAADAAGMMMVRVPHGYPGGADAFADRPQLLTLTVPELAKRLGQVSAA
ncbi:MAG: phosphoglycolate phosphatase [Spiribacter salinus]|uniref:Phosphoglycolate phosphatase n=1 Tax=Spiribacter salinus TaxID=1335746 RepID=A0A540VT79_9GAMM|nr:MAG: phosphoglycolate phosphatase [Spiribacter salinus]